MDINVMLYNPSGGRYVVQGEIEGDYRCLSIKKGAALQSFDATYHFCGTKSAVRRMVGNALLPGLADATTRSIE